MDGWNVIIYFLFMGVLLFIGKILKTKLKILNRIVLPTALLGGALGLLFSNVLLGSLLESVLPSVFPYGTYTIDTDLMVNIVYHCLALGFIALTLRPAKKNDKKVWSTGMIITSTYALQGFLGILLVILFFGDKFIGSGMLVALGFGQGPGLATQFGGMWSEMLEGHGVAIGASYAFLGFVIGGTIGVLIVNILNRRKNKEKTKVFEDKAITTHEIKVDTVKEVSVMDGITMQVVIIFLIYFLVWVTLFLLNLVLKPADGGIGATVFGLLRGFNFIIGIFYAMIYKAIIRRIEKTGRDMSFMTNDYVLSNLSSLFFNIMICGAVLTITIDFISSFGLLLIVVAGVVAISTIFYLRAITSKVYSKHNDEYFVGLFGMLTGTAATGIALLKGLDKNLETPVAEELVLGSGTAIAMALPLFVILMLPSMGYTDGVANANAELFKWIALFGCLVYLLVIVTILVKRGNKAAKSVNNANLK